MMSEEEEVDGKFKVCRQEWRSDTFNDFMERLDERASTSSRKRPRCERYLGTPVKMDPPAKAKEWMVEGRATMPILAPNSPELVQIFFIFGHCFNIFVIVWIVDNIIFCEKKVLIF